MNRFQVWAPDAEQLTLVLPGSGQEHPMQRAEQGWWALEVEQAGHGTDYAYRVDGGEALPDPRSPWQPDGVDGPSRVFDAGRHEWADQDWAGRDVRGSVVYELHIGTFTPEGTLASAQERLAELVDLGVDMVELMPVAAFDGRWGWGYDGVDLYAVHAAYGGPAALQEFVDACHRAGLGVVLDVVYNHLGPSGNHLHAFGPYFTDKHHTPWGQAVNLDDEGSEQVRRWIVDNALRWLADFHVDALRLDAVHALQDSSDRHLLAQLSDEVAQLSARSGRPLSLVAESDLNDPAMVEPTSGGGLGMTAQWSDDFHHALHVTVTGETQGYYADFAGLDVLSRTLTEVFRHAGDWSAFREKVWGAPVDRTRHRGHAFLGYLQDHDQVGNRAVGDRITATVPLGRAAAGAALVLTSPFTPMLFMGEEWAASTPWQYFTDFPDPELGAAVSRGRRGEFADHGWKAEDVPDPQDEATRLASVLRWSEREEGEHARMLDWYRALLATRRAEPDLLADDLSEVTVSTGPDWLVVHRRSVEVLVNLAGGPALLPGPHDAQVLLAWDGVDRRPDGWRLPGNSAVLLKRV